MIQTLAEEDHKCKYHAVEAGVGLERDLVQVEGEGLVDQHLVAGLLVQVNVRIVVVAPALLLPRDAVLLQLGWLVRHKFILSVFVFFSVGNLRLEQCLVPLLVAALVGATEFGQLDEKRIGLHGLVAVAALEDQFVELIEELDGVDGASSAFKRVEVLVTFGVGPLVSLKVGCQADRNLHFCGVFRGPFRR